MPTLPEGARAIDPEAEARRLIAQRNAESRLANPTGQYAVCDGVHLVDSDGEKFIFVRINVSSDHPVDYRQLRSDLGDQLAEVVRANWPQGEVAP